MKNTHSSFPCSWNTLLLPTLIEWSVSFLPIVVCPQPGFPGFSQLNFSRVYSSGRLCYICAPASKTTLDVTYDQGIISAAIVDRRPSKTRTWPPLSATNYQAGNNQGFQTDVTGDCLTVYVNSNSTNVISRRKSATAMFRCKSLVNCRKAIVVGDRIPWHNKL